MNSYIETAISLILIFFIFSVITYVIQEMIAINLQYRGKVLFNSIANLCDGLKLQGRFPVGTPPGVARNTDALYKHPQISSLKKAADRKPAYIPATNFSLALIDSIIANAGKLPPGVSALAHFQTGLASFPSGNGDIYKVIKNLADTSTTINELQNKIETWYNDYMDRVTGWYKSNVVNTTRIIALGVTLFFNINVIEMSKDIFNDSELRGKLVAVAEHVTEHPESVTRYYTETFDKEVAAIDLEHQQQLTTASNGPAKDSILALVKQKKRAAADIFTTRRIAALDSLTKKLSGTGLPIGWRDSFKEKYVYKSAGWDYGWLLLGWLIAAGCISMGAPFWFDILVKAVNLRRAGIKPDTGK